MLRRYARSVNGPLFAAVLVGREALFAVTAVFAPASHSVLQGNGTSDGGGVFGCVGFCPQPLAGGGHCFAKETAMRYPAGSWMTGDGVCLNEARRVPEGQGVGRYGLIGSWDVSKVESMAWRECIWHVLLPF